MLNLAERWRSATPCVRAARLQRFCGDRGGRIGLGKGGALLVKTIRLESLDEGEEVFVRDGRSGGRGALSWQRRSLVFDTRTLQINNNNIIIQSLKSNRNKLGTLIFLVIFYF